MIAEHDVDQSFLSADFGMMKKSDANVGPYITITIFKKGRRIDDTT
jgi:hypothetical protein